MIRVDRESWTKATADFRKEILAHEFGHIFLVELSRDEKSAEEERACWALARVLAQVLPSGSVDLA